MRFCGELLKYDRRVESISADLPIINELYIDAWPSDCEQVHVFGNLYE